MALVHAPDEIIEALEDLPPGVELVFARGQRADLTLWFASTEEQMGEDLEEIVQASKAAPIWVAWPKGGARKRGDLTQQSVRDTAMEAGMVDYKICSLDKKWSGLLFTWRGDGN